MVDNKSLFEKLLKKRKAFGGDKYLKQEIMFLIKKFQIKSIVETGTYLGDTTKEFSKLAKTYTIESNKKYYDLAKESLKEYNVEIFSGSSPKILKNILSKIEGPIIFFLDAHWNRYWPILDELKVIAESGIKDSVIVIHDFHVPNKDFGYDSYYDNKNIIKYLLNIIDERFLGGKKKQKFDWEYIKNNILSINPKYNYYYNQKTEGDNRGVIFIIPEY
ncbi:MAG: hypothetical protein Q8L27_04210 [archaeon]|nr:hypothetical protein [archaeon]